jgi:hypothetical protein
MDYKALKDFILATPALAEHAVTNDMPKQNAAPKDQIIADLMNVPQGTRERDFDITANWLMASLGGLTGARIMRKLRAFAKTDTTGQSEDFKDFVEAVSSSVILMNEGVGTNFGHPETQLMIDSLAALSILSAEDAAKMKAIGKQPSSMAYDVVGEPVTGADVSIALRNY